MSLFWRAEAPRVFAARFGASLMCIASMDGAAHGQNLPPQDPILRIESGMHTAPVSRMDVDRSCRLIVTGSKDKTVRLWEVPEGGAGVAQLRHILRVPIGPGADEGKVFAVAVSPDGKLVAGGGWDVFRERRADHAVYLFDAEKGILVRRLGELGGIIEQLAFSPDGRYLAATISDDDRRGALKVWDTESWRIVAEDREYGAEIFGAAFNASGQLFTVSYDHQLRKYGRDFRLENKKEVSGGRHPFTVAIHPRGDRVAVGFDDVPVVEVYRADDLNSLFVANNAGMNNGDLNSVAWSNDGRRLYAAGRYGGVSTKLLRIWGEEGRGRARDVGLAGNTVHELLPCGDNIAVGTDDPAFGLVNAEGGKLLWQGSVIADMRDKLGRNFTVSADGRRVRFGIGIGIERPVLLDAAAGTLVDSPEPQDGLFPPDTQSRNVTGWQNPLITSEQQTPLRLDGHELQFDDDLLSHALAIAPDGRFAVGAAWHLWTYNSEGKLIWKAPAPPGDIWGVNISRDGRFVIAACGDGSIHWYRLFDGQELLAFFLQVPEDARGDRRWILWTPTGYYNASPGAEKLIGWNVNRGWENAPDFFPVERFRDRFYRPDIILQTMTLVDQAGARVAEIERQTPAVTELLPPVIDILSPRDGTSFADPNVTIEYTVRSPTGEKVTEIETYIDDEKIVTRGFAVAGAADGTLQLTLPRRDVRLAFRAIAAERKSVLRSISLKWTGSAPEEKPKPRLRALLIGVNNYTKVNKLHYADKDARDMDALLQDQKGKAFSEVKSQLLIDPDVTKIRNGLTWLENEQGDNIMNIILLSGHGTTRLSSFYFLPVEADPSDLRNTAITGVELVDAIKNLRGAKLLFVDSCRAGSGLPPTGALRVPVDVNRLMNDMTQPEGTIFFGASLANEDSREDAGLKGGVFTVALIEGLKGQAKARQADKRIETDELWTWLRRRVPELNDRQHPSHVNPGSAEYVVVSD